MPDKNAALALLRSHVAYKFPVTYKEFARLLLLSLQVTGNTSARVDLPTLQEQLSSTENDPAIRERQFVTPIAFENWLQKNYLNQWLAEQEVKQESDSKRTASYFTENCQYINSLPYYVGVINNLDELKSQFPISSNELHYFLFHELDNKTGNMTLYVGKYWQDGSRFKKTLLTIPSHYHIATDLSKFLPDGSKPLSSFKHIIHSYQFYFHNTNEDTAHAFLNFVNANYKSRYPISPSSNIAHYLIYSEREQYYIFAASGETYTKLPIGLTDFDLKALVESCQKTLQNELAKNNPFPTNIASFIACSRDIVTIEVPFSTLHPNQDRNCPVIPKTSVIVAKNKFTDEDINFESHLGPPSQIPCETLLTRRFRKTYLTLPNVIKDEQNNIQRGHLRPTTFVVAGSAIYQKLANYPDLRDAIIINPSEFFKRAAAYGFTGNAYTVNVTGQGAEPSFVRAAQQVASDYDDPSPDSSFTNRAPSHPRVNAQTTLTSSELERLSTQPNVSQAAHSPETATMKQLEIARRAKGEIPDLQTKELLLIVLSKYFANTTNVSIQEVYTVLCFNDLILKKEDYNYLPTTDNQPFLQSGDPLATTLPAIMNFGRLPADTIELLIRCIGRIGKSKESVFNPQTIIKQLSESIIKNNRKGKDHSFRTQGYSARYSVAKLTASSLDSSLDYHVPGILPHNEFVSANMDPRALDKCDCVLYPTDHKTTIADFYSLPNLSTFYPPLSRFIYCFSDPHFALIESKTYIEAMLSLKSMLGEESLYVKQQNLYNPDSVFSANYCTVIRLNCKTNSFGIVQKPLTFCRDGQEGEAWNWLIKTFFIPNQIAAYGEEAEKKGDYGVFYLPWDPITLQWRLLNHIAQYHPEYFFALKFQYSDTIGKRIDAPLATYLKRLPPWHPYRQYMGDLYATKIRPFINQLDQKELIIRVLNSENKMDFYQFLEDKEKEVKQNDEETRKKLFDEIFSRPDLQALIKWTCQHLLTDERFFNKIIDLFSSNPSHLRNLLHGNLNLLPLPLRIFDHLEAMDASYTVIQRLARLLLMSPSLGLQNKFIELLDILKFEENVSTVDYFQLLIAVLNNNQEYTQLIEKIIQLMLRQKENLPLFLINLACLENHRITQTLVTSLIKKYLTDEIWPTTRYECALQLWQDFLTADKFVRHCNIVVPSTSEIKDNILAGLLSTLALHSSNNQVVYPVEKLNSLFHLKLTPTEGALLTPSNLIRCIKENYGVILKSTGLKQFNPAAIYLRNLSPFISQNSEPSREMGIAVIYEKSLQGLHPTKCSLLDYQCLLAALQSANLQIPSENVNALIESLRSFIKINTNFPPCEQYTNANMWKGIITELQLVLNSLDNISAEDLSPIRDHLTIHIALQIVFFDEIFTMVQKGYYYANVQSAVSDIQRVTGQLSSSATPATFYILNRMKINNMLACKAELVLTRLDKTGKIFDENLLLTANSSDGEFCYISEYPSSTTLLPSTNNLKEFNQQNTILCSSTTPIAQPLQPKSNSSLQQPAVSSSCQVLLDIDETTTLREGGPRNQIRSYHTDIDVTDFQIQSRLQPHATEIVAALMEKQALTIVTMNERSSYGNPWLNCMLKIINSNQATQVGIYTRSELPPNKLFLDNDQLNHPDTKLALYQQAIQNSHSNVFLIVDDKDFTQEQINSLQQSTQKQILYIHAKDFSGIHLVIAEMTRELIEKDHKLQQTHIESVQKYLADFINQAPTQNIVKEFFAQLSKQLSQPEFITPDILLLLGVIEYLLNSSQPFLYQPSNLGNSARSSCQEYVAQHFPTLLADLQNYLAKELPVRASVVLEREKLQQEIQQLTNEQQRLELALRQLNAKKSKLSDHTANTGLASQPTASLVAASIPFINTSPPNNEVTNNNVITNTNSGNSSRPSL